MVTLLLYIPLPDRLTWKKQQIYQKMGDPAIFMYFVCCPNLWIG